MKPDKRTLAILALAVLPVVIFLFDPTTYFGVYGAGLKALVVAGVMVLAALGYGSLFLRTGPNETEGPGAFLRIAVGLGIESFVMMVLGFAGFVHAVASIAIMAGGLYPAIKYLRQRLAGFKLSEEGSFDSVTLATATLLVFAAMMSLPVGLMPPLFYDGLVYHLALPKYYIFEGGITIAPYNFFSFFPQSIEMLYMIALLGGGEIAPKALTWIMAALFYWGVSETAVRLGGKRAGPWALLIALGIPWAVICSQIVYIEPAVGMFAMAAFLLAIDLDGDSNLATCVASAIVAGATAASKYNAAPFIAPVGVYAVYKLGRAGAWRSVATYVIAGAAVSAPWYVRNIIVASNPVAPFYFGSEFWTAGQLERYASLHDHYGLGSAPLYKKIFAPLLAFFRPRLFPQGIGFGVAPLFAALFIPFAKSRRKLLGAVSLFAWGALIWTFTSQQPRFMVVSLAFLTGAGAAALAEIDSDRMVGRVAMAALVVVALPSFMTAFGSINTAFRPWKGIAARQPLDDYIEERVPNTRVFRKISQPAPDLPGPDEKVLVLGETRTFYIDRPFIPVTAWDVNPLVKAVAECPDTACVGNRLRSMGVGVIMRGLSEEKRMIEDYNYFSPIPKEKWDLYYKFLEGLPVYGSGRDFFVYLLR